MPDDVGLNLPNVEQALAALADPAKDELPGGDAPREFVITVRDGWLEPTLIGSL